MAAHLAQLGASTSLLSSVGQDALGDEILKVAADKNVSTALVARSRAGLPTGTVIATLDPKGNATYEIVQPVAWDEITIPDHTLPVIASSGGVIFGSLAARSAHNLEQLNRLLALKGVMKFFDVNLRTPFINPPLVINLAKRSDVIKLNDDEVGRLAAWLQTGELKFETPRTNDALLSACSALAEVTFAKRICVTRGANGAALWENGSLICVPAPPVVVKDTVGAGDAFMAGLTLGISKGMEIRSVLEHACRLGAFVASHYGATPIFPPELLTPTQAV